MVRCGQIGADGMSKIIVLAVVQDVVDTIGGEYLSGVCGAGALATAAEGVL